MHHLQKLSNPDLNFRVSKLSKNSVQGVQIHAGRIGAWLYSPCHTCTQSPQCRMGGTLNRETKKSMRTDRKKVLEGYSNSKCIFDKSHSSDFQGKTF